MSSNGLHNFPDDLPSNSRRRFIKSLVGGAAAAVIAPSCGISVSDRESQERTPAESLQEAVASIGEMETGDEEFWGAVKRQFAIRDGLIMLNAANLCPSPISIEERVFELTKDVDADPSHTNRAKFSMLREEAREALAKYLGADTDEIAIVRNTSEGNNVVISGLELGDADEVLIWDQNHPTANVAWDVRAERYGYTVKRVATPENPSSPEELVKVFTDAFGPRTKVLAFSHVSNVSGVRIAAPELCAAARERGILTLIDGAQTFGTYPVNLKEMGCDFFTGSSHKWFCGPKEVGALFVRKDRWKTLHPLLVGLGWERARDDGARKFESLGQRDDSRIAAMKDACDFHNALGGLRISTRARMLADAVKVGLKEKVEDVQFVTPMEHPMCWGVVVFKVPRLDAKGKATSDVLGDLYEHYGVGCAVMGAAAGGPGSGGASGSASGGAGASAINIRFSPHFYNTLDEIGKAVDAVAEMVR